MICRSKLYFFNHASLTQIFQKMRFQSFKSVKTGLIAYNPKKNETFIETFLKPLETFFSELKLLRL